MSRGEPSPELLTALLQVVEKYSASQIPRGEDETAAEYIRRRLNELLGQRSSRKLKPEQLLLMQAGTRLLDEMFKAIAKPDDKEFREFSREKDRLTKIQKIEKLSKDHPRLFKSVMDERVFAMDTTLRRFYAMALPSADVVSKSIRHVLSGEGERRDPFAGQTPKYAKVNQWQVFSGKELGGDDYVITLVKGSKPEEIVTASFEVVHRERFEFAHILVFPKNDQVEVRGSKDVIETAKSFFVSHILSQIKDAPKALVAQDFVGKEDGLAKLLAARHVSSLLKNLEETAAGGGETIEIKSGSPSTGKSLDKGKVYERVVTALGLKEKVAEAKQELAGIDIERLTSCYVFVNGDVLVVYEVWPKDGRIRFTLQKTREQDISKVTNALNTVLGAVGVKAKQVAEQAIMNQKLPKSA